MKAIDMMNGYSIKRINVSLGLLLILGITSLMITLCYFSLGNGNDFLCEGESYFNESPFYGVYYYGLLYDDMKQRFDIIEDDSSIEFTDYIFEWGANSGGNWHYFYYQTDYISEGGVACTAEYIRGGTVVLQEEKTLTLGQMFYSEKAFDSIVLRFKGEKGKQFGVIKFELREKERPFVIGQFVSFFVFIFFVCLSLCFSIYISLFRGVESREKKEIIEIMRCMVLKGVKRICYVCITMLKLICSLFPATKLSFRTRSLLRKSLFLLLLVNEFVVHKYLNGNLTGRYMISVSAIIIALAYFISTDMKYAKCDMGKMNCSLDGLNGWIVLLFVSLMSARMVSDIYILKEYRYVGIWLLLSFGLLYYVWRKINEPELVIRELICSIHIFYSFVLFYSVFNCNNFFYGAPFCGFFSNENTMGVFVAELTSVIFIDFLYSVLNHNIIQAMFHFFEFGSACFMVYRSSSRTAVIVVIIVCLSSFVSVSLNIRNGRIGQRIKGISLGVLALLAFGVCVWFLIEIANNPSFTVNEFSTGRIRIWRNTLGKLNLLGHGKRMRVDKTIKQWIHNSFLAQMYMYGIYTVIPYLLLQINLFNKIIRENKKKIFERKCISLCFASMSGIFVREMIEIFEENAFLYRGELLFYLIIGYILTKDD